MSELILTILSVFITIMLISLIATVKDKIDNTDLKADKLSYAKSRLELIENIIINAVEHTNQIFVDGLKSQGKFDLEAQKTALDMTTQEVMNLLSVETEHLADIIDSVRFKEYLLMMIESAVRKNKNK